MLCQKKNEKTKYHALIIRVKKSQSAHTDTQTHTHRVLSRLLAIRTPVIKVVDENNKTQLLCSYKKKEYTRTTHTVLFFVAREK